MKAHTDPQTGGVGIARNSRGIAFQGDVPDYISLTKGGKPMLDAAERILTKVWGRAL